MELLTLQAERRSDLGKGGARKLRSAGRIPAVCYGLGKEPLSVSVVPKPLVRMLRGPLGRNVVCNLAVEGEDGPRMVFLKAVQIHPVKRKIVHADFLEVTEESALVVDVPVKLKGPSVGEKAGGDAHWVLKKLRVRCVPQAVLASIEVDTTELEIGDVLFADALTLPDGVELVTKGRVPLVSIKAGRAEEEEEVDEELEEGAEGEGDEKAEGASEGSSEEKK